MKEKASPISQVQISFQKRPPAKLFGSSWNYLVVPRKKVDDVARHASTAERRLETLKQETEVRWWTAERLNGT